MKKPDVTSLISTIDSERFGFPVARFAESEMDVAASLSDLRAAGVRLVIARVRTAAVRQIGEMERCGFRLADVQLRYRYDLARYPAAAHTDFPGTQVREYEAPDAKEIVRIAGVAFDGYGHYAADPRIERDMARAIYEDWASRSCADREVADKIFVAEIEGRPAGYLSFRTGSSADTLFAVGGMGAVLPEHRGLGAFKALINAGLAWGKTAGQTWQQHDVIAANVPVNRAFISAGFTLEDSFVTMHCWLD